MKIKILFTALAAVVLLSSCKNYTCECTTSTYDYNSQTYVNTTSSHSVKAMTRAKASTDCATYSYDYETSCSLQ